MQGHFYHSRNKFSTKMHRRPNPVFARALILDPRAQESEGSGVENGVLLQRRFSARTWITKPNMLFGYFLKNCTIFAIFLVY